jgi:hypothetical protein
VDENRCVVDGAWVYHALPVVNSPPANHASAEVHSELRPAENRAAPSSAKPVRTITIHFAEEAPVESQPEIESAELEQSGTSAVLPNRPAQGAGNGVRNMLNQRSSP